MSKYNRLPTIAKQKLEEIRGKPLVVNSERDRGELVAIYPHCDHAALEKFEKNWGLR